MSYTAKGILGVVAVIASFGAAQFAAGEALTVGMRTTGTLDQGVNRAAKTDRSAILAEPVAPTHTIAFHVDRLPDTSILVRVPLSHEARGTTSVPMQLNGERKMTVACEPVVSVLTEIAKRLQPGRCVT